ILELLTLNFTDPVTLSEQNISIYQMTNGNRILRQGFSAKSNLCSSPEQNDFAIRCKIFKSTFNQRNATYYVVMDNNFVMSKSLKQPLTGVTMGNWVYYGGMQLQIENVLSVIEYSFAYQQCYIY